MTDLNKSLTRVFAKGTGLLALALLAPLVAFSYGFTSIGDENDVWWHLKTGEIIAENGGYPPEHDVFAYTSEDMEWHNHEWLAQLAMFAVHQAFQGRALGGMKAVLLAKALLLAVIFFGLWILSARRAGDFAIAAIVAILAVSVARFSVKARPPVITYGFTVVYLILLYGAWGEWSQVWKRWARLAAMTILMVFWVNLHGGFVIGLILIVFFATGAAAEATLQWLSLGRATSLWSSERMAMARGFALCALACALATLINPYGFKIYGMFSRVMGDSALVGAISELRPPDLRVTRAFIVMILALIVVGSLSSRPLPTIADYLILGFFFLQAIQHVRHLPLFAVTVAPILAWQARAALDAAPESWLRWRRPVLSVVAVVFALAAVTVPRVGWFDAKKGRNVSSLERNWALATGPAYAREGFPEEICDYLLAREPRLPGRLFNEIYFAGYLIWRLSPEEYRVFSDSRFDIFGGQFQRQAAAIASAQVDEEGRAVWSDLLRHWGVNLAIIDRYKPLNRRLAESGEWTLARVDKRGYFHLWVRNEPVSIPK